VQSAEERMKAKTKQVKVALSILVGIIGIIAALSQYAIFTDSLTPPSLESPETVGLQASLQICRAIDENYRCSPGGQDFKVGDNALVLITVQGFGAREGKVHLQESFRLRDADGNMVPSYDLPNVVEISQEIPTSLRSIPIKNEVSLLLIYRGQLTIEVEIHDLLLETSTVVQKGINLSP